MEILCCLIFDRYKKGFRVDKVCIKLMFCILYVYNFVAYIDKSDKINIIVLSCGKI